MDQDVEDLAEMFPIMLEAVCNVAYVGGVCFPTVPEFIEQEIAQTAPKAREAASVIVVNVRLKYSGV